MANTYTQLYVHFVIVVKFRKAMLHSSWDENLRQYITGIIQNNHHKTIAINNMPDHMHILIGLYPSQSIADIMRIVKSESSEWINKQRLTSTKFHWQSGYGAFSYSRSQLKNVAVYIERQKEHHSKKSFLEEYKQTLRKFSVEYDERYIFKEPEDS